MHYVKVIGIFHWRVHLSPSVNHWCESAPSRSAPSLCSTLGLMHHALSTIKFDISTWMHCMALFFHPIRRWLYQAFMKFKGREYPERCLMGGLKGPVQTEEVPSDNLCIDLYVYGFTESVQLPAALLKLTTSRCRIVKKVQWASPSAVLSKTTPAVSDRPAVFLFLTVQSQFKGQTGESSLCQPDGNVRVEESKWMFVMVFNSVQHLRSSHEDVVTCY